MTRRNSTDSTVSQPALNRSRTWSEDVIKSWNQPVTSTETFTQRTERYMEYFTLSKAHLEHVYEAMDSEMEKGLKNHSASILGEELPSAIKMLDTCITKLPTGQEKGIAYGLDFSGTSVRAIRGKLDGNGHIQTHELTTNLKEKESSFPKGLMDKKCGAMQLFDGIVDVVKQLIHKSGDQAKSLPLGFTVSFPCDQQGIKNAQLIEWTKGFETGRETRDPVEGMDMAALLDIAFWRNELNVQTAAVLNDTVGALLSCAYEKSPRLPACAVGIVLGGGVNGAYVERRAAHFGYTGCIINTELGAFDKNLPITDVDLEVDFADGGGSGKQIFEKMVSGGYIGEVCRRLVLRVWQSEAPPLAWARQALPAAAAALCVSDTSEDLELVEQVMKHLWDWETALETRTLLQKFFGLVFERSAALAAVAIAVLAKKSGRLQPAMGGVTVAVDGSLYTLNSWYAEKLRYFLDLLTGQEISQLVHLVEATDGAGKGATILANLVTVH